MRFTIASDLPAANALPARLRLLFCGSQAACAPSAVQALAANPFVLEAKASSVTGSVVLLYEAGHKADVLAAVSGLDEQEVRALGPGAPDLGLEFRRKLYGKLMSYAAKRLLLPAWARLPFALVSSLRFLSRAAKSLGSGKLDVAVLDGAAISASMLQGDYNAASSIMFLLGLSSLLQDYTCRQARGALSRDLELGMDTVWVVVDGAERQAPVSSLKPGDHIVIREGSRIPVDGVVVSGEAAVNQASLTGESMPVFKRTGNSVFAGCALEEGMLVVDVRSVASQSRIARIVDLIEGSDALKAEAQSRAEAMSDKLVPFSFLLAGVAFVLGGKRAAMSALLVDYSCAVKLATPIAVISAMREASSHRLLVKGGKFLEAAAEADTFVFDKTGTLTVSSPRVFHVAGFDGYTREAVLRMAACIEEHFPHSLARAVIARAQEEGLVHEEEHAEVKHFAAHGIATSYDGRRVVIGSRHFVEDDEGIIITQGQSSQIALESRGASTLYLGVDGHLAGFLCIDDPPRPEAAKVIAALRALGVENIIMLTGDGGEAARSIAEKLGIGQYKSQVLPEDKQAFVASLKAEGRKVLMVGDGVNDSPALAAADVSVAMRGAADIATETADIALLGSDLSGLVTLRLLGMGLMSRIRSSFAFIIGFNSVLIALGLSGVLSASTLALLHNLSTTAISAANMRPLLETQTGGEATS